MIDNPLWEIAAILIAYALGEWLRPSTAASATWRGITRVYEMVRERLSKSDEPRDPPQAPPAV